MNKKSKCKLYSFLVLLSLIGVLILLYIASSSGEAPPDLKVNGKFVLAKDVTPDMIKQSVTSENEGVATDDGVMTSHLKVSWYSVGATAEYYRTEILRNYQLAFPNRTVLPSMSHPRYGQLQRMLELRVVYMLKSPEFTFSAKQLEDFIDTAVNDCIAPAGNLDESCFEELLPVKMGLDEL